MNIANYFQPGEIGLTAVQKPDLKSIESYEVSFAELRLADDRADAVQKVATAINVQFTEFFENLPFVPSKLFAELLGKEKIFLFGPSGSGKSRMILELLRGKNITYDRIFVINPANPVSTSSERKNISFLARQFGNRDIVIWDNFPDGLIKRDLSSALNALEILSAYPVQSLYIALKPTYLELFRGLTIGIPDIYAFEITCDPAMIKDLIKAYGGVDQYKEVLKFVVPNIDRIARILWKKQPLSLTIVDYYKALKDKSTVTIIDESAALQMAQAWLPANDYFERQFEVMKNIPARTNDVDFLYVLRFCYEVGVERTQAKIANLQKAIFGSESPAEPTLELGTWLYLSGQNYSMHDSVKNSVKLQDHIRMKIISYLVRNFQDIVLKSELYALGLFLGKNIEYISGDDGSSPIPEQIYKFMKTSAVFERAVGRGAGENFERLDDSRQESLLQLVDTELEFGVGLADSLGERFVELDDFNRTRVIEKTYHGMLFARYLGQSIGRIYGKLSGEVRSLLMSHADRNPQLADGLGMGLGYAYSTLDSELQNQIISRAKSNFETTRGIGFGLGLTFGLLQETDAKKIVAMADNNSELDTGFGMGMAVSYPGLPDKLRELIIERANSDCEFAFGVGVYSAYSYKDACPQELFKLLSTNTEIANGLGLGYGPVFFYLPEKFRTELDALMTENVKVDDGVGSGMGLVLKHFPSQIQELMLSKATTRNAFANGLGYGIGYTWEYINENLRKRAIALVATNSEFARGLGTGFGCHLDYLKPEYLAQATLLADTNSELDMGLGRGAAWAWPYFTDFARGIVAERVEVRTEFSRGFGHGLARVVKQYSTEKEDFLGRISTDPFFAEGFAEGKGCYLWSTYTKQEKLRFIEETTSSPEISSGLGIGIGSLYSYFKTELDGDLQVFLKKDPDLRKGIGSGMGKVYKYLPEAARAEGFRIAGLDVDFATGFGQGLGMVFSFLDESDRQLVWSKLGDNGFSRGLGSGLGSTFQYHSNEIKNKILAAATTNSQLSLGLGAAIGMNTSYLPESLKSKFFEQARSNSFLSVGLGEGCARAFQKLRASIPSVIPSYANADDFALGFGFGIGGIRQYLSDVEYEAASKIPASKKRFAEGYALASGSSVTRLDQDQLLRRLSESDVKDFLKHFGFGLGHVISRLSTNARKEILDVVDGEEFHSGLGEGIGHYIPVTGSQLLLDAVPIDSASLKMGLALGVAEGFDQLNLGDTLGMINYADSNPEYGRILGRGLAARFATLGQATQLYVINALQNDNEFSRAFVKSLSASIEYLSAESMQKITELTTKYPHLKTVPRPIADKEVEDIRFALFPVAGLTDEGSGWNIGTSEISFSGEVHDYCVCFIDMVDSTRISAELSPKDLSRYYEIFLNTIARIAKNFGAKIVKNAGDALIFYFEDTNERTDAKFRNVIDCGLTMGMASSSLNAIMLTEKLPPIKYRISADYGQVSVARSQSSQSDDLFGQVMNNAAKINSLARPNGLIIGKGLYDVVRELHEYVFIPVEFDTGKGSYAGHHVVSKQGTEVLNPFDKKASV